MTKIEWTDESWNPCTGCSPISPGCAHCYAERITRRFWEEWKCEEPPYHFQVKLHPDRLEIPIHWRKPRMIFVGSMTDIFHPNVPTGYIDRIMAVIAICPRHTFQILTKRPDRMSVYFNSLNDCSNEYKITRFSDAIHSVLGDTDSEAECWIENSINDVLAPGHGVGWPMRNLWLGITTEDQKRADERIPHLLRTPAAVRFVSAEPLLESIEFSPYFGWTGKGTNLPSPLNNALENLPDIIGLDWVIVGAETGSGKRPMDNKWALDISIQCQAAKVPFFFKKDSVGKGELYGVESHEYPQVKSK